MYCIIYWTVFLYTCNLASSTNDTIDISRSSKGPVVQIHIPEGFPGSGKRLSERDLIQKEDPTDVEEFPLNEDHSFDEGVGVGGVYPNTFNTNNYPPNTFNQIYPTDGFGPTATTDLEAFTARKAIDLELLPGRKIRFLDTVQKLGNGWNIDTSEFICDTPGIFFFTFSICGERNRHFRVTLKVNGIGVVSAYGDIHGYQMATNSALLRLIPRDRVYLQLDEGGIYEVTTITGRAYNTFSGFRIL